MMRFKNPLISNIDCNLRRVYKTINQKLQTKLYLRFLMKLSSKNLLGIKDLSREDIHLILSTASQFKEVLQRPVKKVPSLRDVTIVNLFYENSTRT